MELPFISGGASGDPSSQSLSLSSSSPSLPSHAPSIPGSTRRSSLSSSRSSNSPSPAPRPPVNGSKRKSNSSNSSAPESVQRDFVDSCPYELDPMVPQKQVSLKRPEPKVLPTLNKLDSQRPGRPPRQSSLKPMAKRHQPAGKGSNAKPEHRNNGGTPEKTPKAQEQAKTTFPFLRKKKAAKPTGVAQPTSPASHVDRNNNEKILAA